MTKSSRKSPSSKSPSKDEPIAHYNAILLEDIQSKMDLVIEGMFATEERLTVKMLDMKSEIMGEIGTLKLVVTTNSRDIQELKGGMQKLEQRLDAKIDGVEQRLDAKIDGVGQRLDAKIDGVGQRLIQVDHNLSDKIDRRNTCMDEHEDRITILEKICMQGS